MMLKMFFLISRIVMKLLALYAYQLVQIVQFVLIHLEFEKKNEFESRFSSKLRSGVTCVINGYDVIM